MENILDYSVIKEFNIEENKIVAQNLSQANVDQECIIKDIETDDHELKSFLLTLGCYQGEKITVISALGGNYIVNVKDARYSIDEELAQAIIV